MSVELSQENLELLEQVARELSVIDGAEWFVATYGPDQDRYALHKDRSQEMIAVRGEAAGWRGPAERFTFTGNVPYDLWKEYRGYDETQVSASCSVTRTAKALAGEIARRVLPAYRDQLATILAKKAKNDTYQARLDAIYDRLIDAFGEGETSEGTKNRDGSHTLRGYHSGRPGRVSVRAHTPFGPTDTSKESVSLTLDDLPVDFAVELLRLTAARLNRLK